MSSYVNKCSFGQGTCYGATTVGATGKVNERNSCWATCHTLFQCYVCTRIRRYVMLGREYVGIPGLRPITFWWMPLLTVRPRSSSSLFQGRCCLDFCFSFIFKLQRSGRIVPIRLRNRRKGVTTIAGHIYIFLSSTTVFDFGVGQALCIIFTSLSCLAHFFLSKLFDAVSTKWVDWMQ